MKVYENLPDSITLSNGLVLRHRVLLSVGFETMARQKGLKFRVIGVRQKELKRRVDLHGEPYKPVEWLFTDKPLENKEEETDWYDWDRHHGSLLVKNLRTGETTLVQGEDGGTLEDDLDRIVDIWFHDPENKEGRGPKSMNEHLDLILCNYFGED